MSSKRRSPRRRRSDEFQAGPGMLVSLRYELRDAEGEVVEVSDDGAPLELLLGYGEASPALERALEGLAEGQSRDIVLDEEEAFGPRDPNGFIEVDAADLPTGLAPGDELVADKEGGGSVPLKVVEVLPDIVVLDTNHPLSGQRIELHVVVEGVKPASPERIAQAAERLTGRQPVEGPLLPAERLLRRGRLTADRPDDEPPPRPTRVA